MKRQALNDGGWFDVDAATMYEETQHHDGRNMVSNATGDQWEHEALYCTGKGTWILNHWSQWQGSRETWERITPEEAAAWFVKCEKPLPDSLTTKAAEQEV